MFTKRAALVIAYLLGVLSSAPAFAGTLNLGTFTDETTGSIDLSAPPTEVLMATITSSGQQGGDDALTTSVTIIGTGIQATDIDQIRVTYGGTAAGSVASPGSLTNIVIDLPGNQRGNADFQYFVTLNANASGKTIIFRVNNIIAANLGTTPLPNQTIENTIVGASAPPQVSTNLAANPVNGSPGTADLGGNVSNDGGEALTEVGIYWSTTQGFDPGTQGTKNPNPAVPGVGVDFAETISFSPGIYYFRAYAANSQEAVASNEETFTIKDIPVLVDPPVVVQIGAASGEATIGGEIVTANFGTISSCGIEWGTSSGSYPNPVPFGGSCDVGVQFNVPLAGLTNGQTYYARSYAVNEVNTGYSASDVVFTPYTTAQVTTSAAPFSKSDVQAVLEATLDNDGGNTVTDCGIAWSTASDPTEPYSYSNSGSFGICSVATPYTVTATSLDPGTNYYYRAFVTNAAGTSWGTEYSFVTDPGAPSMVADPVVQAVGTVSGEATLRGELASTGGGTISDCGVAWGTTSQTLEPYSYSSSSSFGICSVGGPFDVGATGLTNGQTYYFRSWATNESGTSYSANENSFIPYTVPTITTGGATPSTDQATLAATVNDAGGGAITDCTIKWGLTSDLTDPYTDYTASASYGVCSAGIEFTVNATGLNPGATYYYRAFTTTDLAGEAAAANEGAFATPATIATVATRPVENLTSTSADLGGDVTSDGGSAITDRGIVWNTTNTWNTANPPATSGGTPVSMGTGTGPFVGGVTYSPAGALIYFRAYAVNAQGPAYSDVQSFQFIVGQASDIVIGDVTGQAIQLSWTPGAGDGSIVIIRETGTTSTDLPQDGVEYFAQPNIADAPETTGGSQNYVVYQGSGNSVWINGLTLSTAYTITVYDYSGSGATTTYRLDTPPEVYPSTTNLRVHNSDYQAKCGTDCHNGHGGFRPTGTALSDVCMSACHTPGGPAENKLQFTSAPGVSTVGHPGIGKNLSGQLITMDCGTCHELHSPGAVNTTVSTHSITGATQQNKSFLRANVTKYVPTAQGQAYLHNDQPLREDPHPDAPQPADTPDRGVEGGDDTTARGYCQVCHTYTNYHRGTGQVVDTVTYPGQTAMPLPQGGPNQDARCHDGFNNNSCGENGIGQAPTLTPGNQVHCGTCHQHKKGFAGEGGNTSCVVCHASEQPATEPTPWRPIITTQFDRNSVHLTGGSANLAPADCEVCHDQFSHKTGQVVRLKNLDGGLSFVQPDALVSPKDFTQAPAFEGHCLSCHEDKQADALPNPSQPFSATNPANFAALQAITGWANAGHNGPVTCVGDGQTGCHASGHGTASNSLLASWIGGSGDPATNAPPASMQTFCMNCHDGGVSSIDITTQFQSVTNFRTTADDGALVNQRHDVFNNSNSGVYPNYTDGDQTYSSAVLGCQNCHSPHADGPNGRTDYPKFNIADPDTGLPLPPYNVTNSYTENSKSIDYDDGGTTLLDPVNPQGITPGTFTEPDYIQFCLACHDGSPPDPSIVMTANLLDIGSTYVGDYHGQNSGSGNGASVNKGALKYPWVTQAAADAGHDPTGYYAAINCTTCHGAHGSDNIFNLRSRIKVGGVQMSIGGGGNMPIPARITDPTTYDLPRAIETSRNSGIFVQADHYWGAWCSFCHRMDGGHAGKVETDSCTKGHKHGGGAF